MGAHIELHGVSRRFPTGAGVGSALWLLRLPTVALLATE